MTPVRSTPRWLSRLSSLLLILALLTVLVVPAFAQDGVAPQKPPAGDATQELLTGATCAPLTDQEKVEYDSLAARKADGLSDADYGRLIALGQKSDCEAQPNVLIGPEVVSAYTFGQSSGTYTAIVGGSTLGTATNDDTLFPNLDIGFSFTYNDNPYTKVAICSNGYIVMGLTTGSLCDASYTPISSTTYNNLISALGRDLQGNTTTGELRYQTQGSAPNRTFTAQWKSYRKWNVAGDDFNFQITLNETTNVVQIIYGAFTVNATSSTPEVGIKGASNADYSNRTTTTDWSASTAGGTNAATMTLSSAVKPASGQTYTWTPPVVVTPPSCATSFSPADLATGVAATANLTWASGGGAPTGYKIFFGTDNPPTNIANGTDLGLVTTYDPPGNMAYSTLHYWKIVPYNANGDATGCAAISFTTEPVTVFPYAQSFGTATCTIPAGWTNDPANGENWLFDVPGNNADPAQYGADADHTTGTGCIAWVNDSSPDNANPAQLVSPPLNISALSAPTLSFWYQNVDGGSVGAVSVLKVDVFNGTSWQEDLLTVNTALDNWTEFTLDLTPYKSTSTRIRFQANEQIGDFDSDPSLDDVTIFNNSAPPACATSFSPANSATNVAATANLTWASGGGIPTGYKIFFGTDNPPTNIANGTDLGLVTTYDPPGNMAYSTLHYWKIVPYNANGDATGCSVLSFTTGTTYSGSYNVGAGQPYTSLTNPGGIFEAINAGALTGNVTINITSDLAGELGTNALNQWAEDGVGGYTMLIKPSGAPRTITGSNAGALIKLNGADGVRIDGSTAATFVETVGGNPALRELTIQNTNTGTSAAVISVQSGTNGAQNNTIKNVNVLGQDPTTTLVGIALGGNTLGTVGTDNDGNRVENCSVKRAIYGIYSAGASAANPNTGTVITQNDLSATTTDRIRRVGIVVFNEDGVQITENSVGGLDTNEGADGIGIGVGTQGVDTTNTSSGGVTNAFVSRNKVNGVNSASTVGYSAAGIAVAGGAGGANTLVNNMITGVTSPATSPDIVAGIYVVGAAGSVTQLYYNSVSMTGDRGTVASQTPSFGLAVTGTDPAVVAKNNIFYTTQTASGGGVNAKSYAIGMVTTTFVNLDSNYNAFYSAGANDGGFRTGSLSTAAGADYAALAGWQAAVSDDANSIEADPVFVNPLNDLHINNALRLVSPVDNAGTPIAGITIDYDGGLRNATTPDIGGDEIGAPLAVTLASFGAQGGTDRVTVSWETLSEVDNAGFNVYRADDAAGQQTLLAYVPSQGPGSPQGFSYTYDDLAVQSGHTYWYWLEAVSLGGATAQYGPVSATVSAPTAVTLTSFDVGGAMPAMPAAVAGLASLAALAGIALHRRRAS